MAKCTKDELSGDREVIKNNQLINAHYKLSAGEQKLILTLCSKIKSDDITFKEYELKASEFFELLGLKSLDNYTQLINVSQKLAGKVMKVDTGNGFRLFPWLHHVEHKKDEGKILLQFHEELAPYLLYVKNNIYTKYKLGVVLQFKSEYSIRVYELMKQFYPRIKERVMTLVELRQTLGIDKKEYELYGHFKQKVIKQAIKEINNSSDIEIKVEEIKKGRKVVSLHFEISKNYKFDMPIDNWYDLQKYKEKPVEELAEIFCDMLKEKYKVELSKNSISIYHHRALLSTIFELKEGYYAKSDIKNPLLYFLKVLETKTEKENKYI